MREGRKIRSEQVDKPEVAPEALDGQALPRRDGAEVHAPEVRGPPAGEAVPDAASGKVEGDPQSDRVDNPREVTTSAEELERWKKDAAKTLSLFREEHQRLTLAAEQFLHGGWEAVTALEEGEKAELMREVEQMAGRGELPIPDFVPGYLPRNVKRLEERLLELDRLVPGAGDGAPERVGEAGAVPNAYEEKLERRRERLMEAAKKAEARASAAHDASGRALEGIPPGQPILRGHHSERAHRAAVHRSNRAMDRSVEEAERAKELSWRGSRVGTAGISADDPDAAHKLALSLGEMEMRRDLMKQVNREYKKGGWAAVTAIPEAAKAKLQAGMEGASSQESKPFPEYALKNLGANIRRVQKRIEQVKRVEFEGEMDDVVCEHGTYRVSHDSVDNRVRFYFPAKPSLEVRAVLKRESFRWAPSVGAWQRQMSVNGIAAAERVRARLDALAQGRDGARED